MKVFKYTIVGLFLVAVVFSIYVLHLLYTGQIERAANCKLFYQATIPPTLVANLDSSISTRGDIENRFRQIVIGQDTYSSVNATFGEHITYCSDEQAIFNRAEYRCIYNIGRLDPSVSIEFNFDTSVVEEVNISICTP